MYEEASRELVVARPDHDEFEVRMAMTGLLAGFSGLTRDAYALARAPSRDQHRSPAMRHSALRRTQAERHIGARLRRSPTRGRCHSYDEVEVRGFEPYARTAGSPQ